MILDSLLDKLNEDIARLAFDRDKILETVQSPRPHCWVLSLGLAISSAPASRNHPFLDIQPRTNGRILKQSIFEPKRKTVGLKKRPLVLYYT